MNTEEQLFIVHILSLCDSCTRESVLFVFQFYGGNFMGFVCNSLHNVNFV